MAHELEQVKTLSGETMTSFAFTGAREDIWHRLGQSLGGRTMTTDEALVAANMDREVTIISPALPDGTEWGIAPQKFVVLAGKAGITPEGDLFEIPSKVVGLHGEGGAEAHEKISMRDRFEYAEMAQHVTRGKAVWSTAGMLRNGTQGFAVMETDPTIIDPNGVADAIRNYLTVSWSFDGSRATELATSQIRVVCANTLAWHDGSKKQVVKVKHTSGEAAERLKSVTQQIAIQKDREAALRLMAERMLAIPNGKKVLTRFVEQVLFPADLDASKRANTIRDNKIMEVETLYYASTNSPAVGDNGWAAYNTLVEYFDWYSPVRGKGDETAARLANQFDGTYSPSKSEFADFILAGV
jgi:phage/plasmid-like protein (TIGR03299 family)